jgi:hypothetical protein
MKSVKNSPRKNTGFKKKWAWFTFIFLGIASTAWFLIRVIPKPSRASYPCIKAAAPLMSSFVVWLIGISASTLLFKKAIDQFKKARVPLAIIMLITSFAAFTFSSVNRIKKANASPYQATIEDYPANEPYGEAKGIFPGRVVWYWNPDATNESSTMTVNGDGIVDNNDDVYYLPKNNNEAVIDDMFDKVMLRLTGATSVASAWDSVFRYHNRTANQIDSGYSAYEKIYIKTNNQGIGLTFPMNQDLSQKDYTVWGKFPIHMTATSPYSILATLKHLVNEAGIPQENIYIGDPHNNFNNIYYNIIRDAFANVHIIGVNQNAVVDCEAYGRTLSVKGTTDEVFYSEKGVLIDGGSDKFYQQLIDADYIINIAAFKSHIRGGISLFCKSHFGSHTRDGASHLHPGLVAPEGGTPDNAGYEKYRVLTDLMGHENLGGKRIISILDGLWGGPPHELYEPRKWDMAPFNGDWTSSIFVSLDPVAISSVAHDFLRTEYSIADWGNEAYPNILGVDDYLHQAADDQFWPEGITYDPENDGAPLGSLGTHEHWNNDTEMLYSRNLDSISGKGIQLVKIHSAPSVGLESSLVLSDEFTIYPNPASHTANLKIDNNYSGNVEIVVFSMNGQEIVKNSFKKVTRYYNHKLELNDILPGSYIITVKMGDKHLAKQLLIAE